MADQYQIDRQYSLIIGSDKEAVEINNLQIVFSVTKTSSNKDKKNKAKIEIYNLSKEKQILFEKPYTAVVLSVGYYETGVKRLFAGQTFSVGTRKSGANVITEIEIENLYSELNFNPISKLVPAGRTVKNVIEEVVKSTPSISKSIFNGANIQKTVVDGYPMQGVASTILDDLSRSYAIDWQIDDGVLFISDQDDAYTNNSEAAFFVHEESGLIERPYWDTENIKDPQGRKVTTTDSAGKAKTKTLRVPRKSIRFKVLLNPAIYAGTILKLQYPEMNGFYKVDEVTHSGSFMGGDWTSEVRCSERVTT